MVPFCMTSPARMKKGPDIQARDDAEPDGHGNGRAEKKQDDHDGDGQNDGHIHKASAISGMAALEQSQFETLRVSNHTAWRFAEKTRFFRLVSAGRRCAAASHVAFFKGTMLYQEEDISL